MKRLMILACAISLIFGTYSCSNDFELVDKWKDIPVVYGLLSVSDTAHYIRVEKAFLDANTSAFDIAQIVDSLYYDDAAVTLIRDSDNKRYPMSKVDGNLEGYVRDEGDFADVPNYLYKYKFPANEELIPGAKYQLEINRGDDLPLVIGETTVLDSTIIKQPFLLGGGVKFTSGSDVLFQWSFNEDQAYFFDIFIDFFYTEEFGGVQEDKVFRWELKNNITDDTGSPASYKFEAIEFYKAVATNISPSVGEVRRFQHLEFGVKSGGEEIYEYITINDVNTGITGSQLLPNYTNMSEGYGIFSSTNVTTTVRSVDLTTLDSLEGSFYTSDLNFQ